MPPPGLLAPTQGATPVPPRLALHSTGTLFSRVPPSLHRRSQQLVFVADAGFPGTFCGPVLRSEPIFAVMLWSVL